jgi:general secretion pathway protein G
MKVRREVPATQVRLRRPLSTAAGMTLLELIIACSLLLILSSMALPVLRYTITREKENELRTDLLTVRDAIDRYKELADEHKFRTQVGSENYPPDLDTLVKGVQLGTGGDDRRLRFLRKIPVDPMTGQADWGLRCVSDDLDSTTWCGTNVFDLYSKSTGTAVDGTKYKDW